MTRSSAPLRLVVDNSVLVAELLRASGRARVAHPDLSLYLPEWNWEEVRHEIPKRVARIANNASLTPEERRHLVTQPLLTIEANVTTVLEAAYLPLESEARWRIARDERDWPTVALALVLGCGIWTEARDFLGCGLATWSTSTLTRFLSEFEHRRGESGR